MKKNTLLTALACAVTMANISVAEQNGSGHYMSGQQADLSSMNPTAPGWIFANYFLAYQNGDLSGKVSFGRNDVNGHITANLFAEVPAVIYAYPFNFLGGTLSSGAFIPYVSLEVKASGTITHYDHLGNPTSLSRSTRDTTSGLGDIEFAPIMAGWTNGDFHFGAAFNFWAPTGEYDKEDLANAGLGYWTFEPMLTLGWLSSKIGTEVSLVAALDFNTENTEADYQSGNIFHLDGTVAQHLPLFGGFAGVGATAFYLKQFTGDSGSGNRIGNFMAESYGVGPTISYVHKVGKSTLVVDASFLPQLHTQNTTGGNFIWAKLAWVF